MKAKLTKALAERTQSGAGEIVIRDSEVTGLALRVTSSGAKSLFIRFRIGKGRGAPVRQPTIPVDPLSPGGIEKARKIAREWREKGAEGIDVSRELRAEATAPTMNRLCEDYMAKHAVHKRSAAEDQRRLSKLSKSFLRLRVKDVGVQDVQTLHSSRKDTPYEANRLVALLAKMFALAVQWDWIDRNPAAAVTKFREEKRERFLDAGEVARLDDALDAYEATRGDAAASDAVDAFRLLLLTGCRVGELLAADWSQFDLLAGIWTKPSSHTKTKKVHKVTLSTPASVLLRRLKERHRGQHWVLPGVRGHHRTSLRSAWYEIREEAALDDVRIHDLRHTSASLMLSSGIPLDIVGRVLGHTQAQTTLRYAHLTDEASRAATDALGKVVAFREKSNR